MGIDIDWRVDDQFRILSNLAEKPFGFDYEHVGSIEAVLQSLKVQDATEQAIFWTKPPFWCMKMGRKIPWQQTRLLWWKGVPMDRDGEEYQIFLDRLYAACYAASKPFRDGLIASGDKELMHTIGTIDQEFTILTQEEFLSRLLTLRMVAIKNPA